MAASSAAAGQFRLLYFAGARDMTKKASEMFQAPMSPVELFQALERQYPGIQQKVLASAAWTINLDYVDLDDEEQQVVIRGGDEVAIIPPVSSG